MVGGIGTREIASRYPAEEGLTAGTTKQTGDRQLTPQEKSLILERDKALMD